MWRAFSSVEGRTLTVSYIVVVVLLFFATLNSFGFTSFDLGKTTTAILILSGGIMAYLESIFEGKRFELSKATSEPSDVLGIVTGTLAIILFYGIITNNALILKHLQSTEGGVFLFLLVYLLYEGIKNRV